MQEYGTKFSKKLIAQPDFEWLMIDASHCKVHSHAAGAKGGNQEMSKTKWGSTQKFTLPWMQMVCWSEYLSRRVPELIAKKLILFRNHGITRVQEWMDKESEGGWYYQQVALGYNYRITDMQAALLSSQLDKLDMFAARREELVRRYDEAFS